MKARRPGDLLLFCVVLVVAGAWVTLAEVAHLQYRYSPGPEHESAFLRNYNVRPVIDSFAAKGVPVVFSGGTGASAGREFVRNRGEINPIFAIRSEMRPSFLTALRQDVTEQMARNGATIIASSGDVQSGFRIAYRDGTSAGTVTLSPLAEDNRLGMNEPRPEGTEAVRADIIISEKWFPEEAAAIRASVESQ